MGEPTSAWHLISSARCRRTVFVKKFVSVGGLTKVSVAQQHDETFYWGRGAGRARRLVTQRKGRTTFRDQTAPR